jgi:hypothetical protein
MPGDRRLPRTSGIGISRHWSVPRKDCPMKRSFRVATVFAGATCTAVAAHAAPLAPGATAGVTPDTTGALFARYCAGKRKGYPLNQHVSKGLDYRVNSHPSPCNYFLS